MALRTAALLIDDDARLGTLMTEYLGKHEIDVVVAGDGPRVLPPLRKTRPDIVLLDIMLPGMDGLEVCRKIRATPDCATLPVIMLTAKGEDVDKGVGLEGGADDYLAKPLHPPGAPRADSRPPPTRRARPDARPPSRGPDRARLLRARGHGGGQAPRAHPSRVRAPRHPGSGGRARPLPGADPRRAQGTRRRLRPLHRRAHRQDPRQARGRSQGAALHQDGAGRGLPPRAHLRLTWADCSRGSTSTSSGCSWWSRR